jgi:hypothetical protein
VRQRTGNEVGTLRHEQPDSSTYRIPVASNSPSLGPVGMDHDPQFGRRDLAVVEFRELANRPPLPWQMWPTFTAEMHALHREVTRLPE